MLQARALSAKIEREAMPMETASAVMNKLDAGPWTVASKQLIVQSASTSTAAVACAANKKKTQDMLNVENYLTESQWQSVQHAGFSRSSMHSYLQVLAKLGLRNPTEKTMQSVMGAFLHLSIGFQSSLNMDAMSKLAVLKDMKDILRGMPDLSVCGHPSK